MPTTQNRHCAKMMLCLLPGDSGMDSRTPSIKMWCWLGVGAEPDHLMLPVTKFTMTIDSTNLGDPRLLAGIEGLRIYIEMDSPQQQLGWKIGFGSPGGLAALNISGLLVGALISQGHHPPKCVTRNCGIRHPRDRSRNSCTDRARSSAGCIGNANHRLH